jgi:tetrahydromethanopterin S-methyltransferase subunit F
MKGIFPDSNDRNGWTIGFVLPWVILIAIEMLLCAFNLWLVFSKDGLITGIVVSLLWVMVIPCYICAYKKSRDRRRARM